MYGIKGGIRAWARVTKVELLHPCRHPTFRPHNVNHILILNLLYLAQKLLIPSNL